MKNPIVLLALIAFPCLTKAQLIDQPRQTVRLSADLLYIKGESQRRPPAIRYGVYYATRLGQSRWQLESGLTFAQRSLQLDIYPYGYTYTAVRSRLITADVNVMYNLLKSPRHAWRIGAGPSFWYSSNSVSDVSTIWLDRQGGLDRVDLDRSERSSPALGLTLRTTYEYALTPTVSIGAQAGISGNLTSIRPHTTGGLDSSLQAVGLQIGYRF